MSETKEATRVAVLELLVRIARLALKVEMGVGECTHLCERAFVVAAKRAFAEENRPEDNVSWIANRTGLTRKKVSLLESTQTVIVPPQARGQSRTGRVVAGWKKDPRFQDAAGQPRILPLRGPRSFAELVRKYSKEERSKPVLKELEHQQIVRIHDKTRIELLRGEVGDQLDPEGILELGRSCGEVLEALLFNLEHPEGGVGRYYRHIANVRMKKGDALVQTRDRARQIQSMGNTIAGFVQDPAVTVVPSTEPQEAVNVNVVLCVSHRPVVVPPIGARRNDREIDPEARRNSRKRPTNSSS